MPESHAMQTSPSAAEDLPGGLGGMEECWSRIGTRGDNSCPELQQHVRCRNCPTYSRAARQWLDRVAASPEVAQEWMHAGVAGEAPAHAPQQQDSALVVRVGGEWLAIATGVVQEVAEARPVHSLPHQRNPAISGVLNIRGSLRICVSLVQLFQLQPQAADRLETSRLVVAAHEGQILVFPVEEVAGLHRYDAATLAPVPTTLAQAAIQYTRGMLAWRGRQIGLLDHELLFYVLNRSMT